jgi:hypothetical protein
MLICPFCDRELKPEDIKDGGWHCECGEFVPENLAVDTARSKCGKRDNV